MPDTPPIIHAQVDDLLQQAKLATTDLTTSDKARRDGIGVLAAVIDQQREMIRSLITEQEDLREVHRDALDALEKRVALAESGKAEAVALAEKAVGRATAAEARMAEMTKVFDTLVTSVSERNRVRIEEDRSIEEIVARSGVKLDVNQGPLKANLQPKMTEPTSFAPAAVRIPLVASTRAAEVASPAPARSETVKPAVNPITAPAASKITAPSAVTVTERVSAVATGPGLARDAAGEAEDVFSEATAAETISPEERGEERRAFSGAMDAFRGLLKSRARTPLSQTQEA